VLHNMRPGAAARLGIDAATVLARNPRVVHCAAVGYGSGGPYRDQPAYDRTPCPG
jgi:crotonobetainyl-CoA:carnitine CoA-transferase CaiB-like acyl-CoA transferase